MIILGNRVVSLTITTGMYVKLKVIMEGCEEGKIDSNLYLLVCNLWNACRSIVPAICDLDVADINALMDSNEVARETENAT